jgi:hypothetical protein
VTAAPPGAQVLLAVAVVMNALTMLTDAKAGFELTARMLIKSAMRS